MSEDLLITREGGVLRLTLNRPGRLNAVTSEMLDAMRSTFEEAGRDTKTRVIVLTGAGRAFCAGQDLSEPGVAPGSDLGVVLERHYNPLIRTIRALEKPVLARVNGIAAGAGANLAFACDIVVAAASAKFTESFIRIGLLPDSGGTWMLPKLIGYARAAALTMLGTPITAQQAYEWGAIWAIADDAQLDAQCDALLRNLEKAPTKAVGAIKSALEAGWSGDLPGQLELERKLQGELGATGDFHEGVEAFVQKREPSFEGK